MTFWSSKTESLTAGYDRVPPPSFNDIVSSAKTIATVDSILFAIIWIIIIFYIVKQVIFYNKPENNFTFKSFFKILWINILIIFLWLICTN